MKIIFILTTAYTIYLIRWTSPICQTYDKQADSLNYPLYLILPATVLALISTSRFRFVEILWTFSIWLEAGAILPQLLLLQKLREVENLTSHYVAALGLYRAFYILNWIYRYRLERYVNIVGWIGGVVQVGLYIDFFYYYISSRWSGRKLILPFAETAQA